MKPRKPPTLNAADLRLIKDIQLPIERRLTAMEKKIARLENRRPSVLIADPSMKLMTVTIQDIAGFYEWLKEKKKSEPVVDKEDYS